MSGAASSTRTRTDFIKGVYCAWLLKKSDWALEEMLLRSPLDLPEAEPGIWGVPPKSGFPPACRLSVSACGCFGAKKGTPHDAASPFLQ